MQQFISVMIDDAGLAIQSKSETIAAMESWIGPLTFSTCRAPVMSSAAIECEASIYVFFPILFPGKQRCVLETWIRYG